MDLTDGQVVLTIPASFDDIARNLTAEAAEAAGLGKVVLLEEPLAAFYAWTAQAGKDWRALVRPGDIVLVCDVGGGTADFSLIAISEKDGALDLNRISVGEHILLGGDNMDLALAYALRAKLEADGKSISDMQFLSLTHSAGKAKVAMLEDESMTEFPIAVPTRGSSLLGKTVSTKLDRQTLEQIVGPKNQARISSCGRKATDVLRKTRNEFRQAARDAAALGDGIRARDGISFFKTLLDFFGP